MKQTTPSTRAPRQKAGESDSAFKKRTEAYYKAKEIRDYENRNPDLEPEQAEDAYITKLAAQIEEEAALALNDPEDEEAQYASWHHNPTPYLGLKRLEDVPEPQEAPQAPSNFDHVLSRLDELQGGVDALTSLVDKLARLIAATIPARTLKPAVRSAVLDIAPELAEAYRDDRVREICETYEHVVNMGYAKKRSANFPRALDDKIDYTGYRPEDTVVCRVIPYSALIARCSAKKAFRVVPGEDSAVQNVKLACIKAGMVVTTLDKAGMKRGSHVQIIMDHAEAVKRGLVKGLEPVPELQKPEPVVEPPAPPVLKAWHDGYVEPKKVPNPVEKAIATHAIGQAEEMLEKAVSAAKPKAFFDKAAWADADEAPAVAKPATRVVIEEEPIQHPVMNNDAPPAKIGDYKPSVQAAIKKGNPRFAEWTDETTVDVVDEPTTTDAVDEPSWEEPRREAVSESTRVAVDADDEGGVDDTEWEEEDNDGFNENPLEIWKLSGEQEKAARSSKAVDLFAD